MYYCFFALLQGKFSLNCSRLNKVQTLLALALKNMKYEVMKTAAQLIQLHKRKPFILRVNKKHQNINHCTTKQKT